MTVSIEPLLPLPPPPAAGPPPLGAKRAFWLFIAYLLVQLGVGLIGGIGIGVYGAFQQMSPEEIAGLASGEAMFPIALACVLAGGGLAYALVRRSYPGRLQDGALAPIGWAPTTLIAAVAATIAGATLAYVYLRIVTAALPPGPDVEFGPLSTAATTAVGLAKFIWIVLLLIAAPIEEFLFRGAMMRGFAKSFGSSIAGILVTGLFVLCHLPETRLYLPAIVSIGAMGLLALIARQWSGSLLTAICVHASYNLMIAAHSFE